MACYKGRANCNPIIPGSDLWGCLGPGQGICDKCLNGLKIYFPNEDAPTGEYRGDYLRILLLLQQRVRVDVCMSLLASELAQEQRAYPKHRDPSIHTKNGYVKLSKFLEKYETLCWFPPCHLVFTGFVPPVNFPKYLARGLIAKDPGAGPKHGDFTHRLQWHAISRVVTKNFTVPIRPGWDHSPLELLTSLGSNENAKFWKALLEKGEGYCLPDRFHEELRKSKYGVLAKQVGLRWIKRVNQYNQARPIIDQQIEDQARKNKEAYGVLPGPQGRPVLRVHRVRDPENKLSPSYNPPEKDRYFMATQHGVDQNIQSKKHYVKDGAIAGDPAMQNIKGGSGDTADMLGIEQRKIQSRSRLNDASGTYEKNLGILHQGKRELLSSLL